MESLCRTLSCQPHQLRGVQRRAAQLSDFVSSRHAAQHRKT
jgi:hypothetical protein